MRKFITLIEQACECAVSADDLIAQVEEIHHTPSEVGVVAKYIRQYATYRLSEIPTDMLPLDQRKHNAERAARYAEQIKDDDSYPAIIYDPVNDKIIDGNHRSNALAAIGAPTVRAYIGNCETYTPVG